MLVALLTAWAVAAAAALGALALVTNVTARWGLLRAVLAVLSGARPRGVEGVVLQEGALGCGKAALGTLFLKRGDAERADETARRVPPHMPLSMQQAADLLAEAGLPAAGYEFQSVDQLRTARDGRPGSDVLLLLHEYGSGALVPQVLLLPFQVLFRVHRRLRGAAPAVHHWAVLESASAEELVLLDPFLGRVAWRRRRFARTWTGYALLVGAAEQRGHRAVG